MTEENVGNVLKTLKTVCVQCLYHRLELEPGPEESFWTHRCTAKSVRLRPAQDPVTGRWGWRAYSGIPYVVFCEYPYCRDVNDGNCPHFK